jgi:optic atrophy protein 1
VFQKHPPSLSYDEIMTVKKIMERSNIDVDSEYIRETWHPIYRRHFLKQSLARAYDCRKGYYLYHQGLESEVIQACLIHNMDIMLSWFFCSYVSCFTCYKAILYVQVDCADVVLFWRIQQVLKVTANALRQQVMNREGEYEVSNFLIWVRLGAWQSYGKIRKIMFTSE